MSHQRHKIVAPSFGASLPHKEDLVSQIGLNPSPHNSILMIVSSLKIYILQYVCGSETSYAVGEVSLYFNKITKPAARFYTRFL